MKNYIAAILIPCLLLQFSGCYSFKEITIEELKNYKGTNDIRINIDCDEILIKRDSTKAYVTGWEASDSLIIVQEKSICKNKKDGNPGNKQIEIKFSQIKDISLKEYDSGATERLILSTIIFLVSVAIMLIDRANQNLINVNF